LRYFVLNASCFESGDKQYMQYMAHDITDLKLLETRLQESLDSLKMVQEIAKLGSWELTLPDMNAKWSEEVTRIFGLENQKFDMSFQTFTDRVYPEDRQKMLQKINNPIHRKAPLETEYRILRPDGQIRWVLSRTSVHYNDNGKPEVYTGTLQDITQMHNLQETLRESEKKYRAIFENAQTSLAVYDLESMQLVDCNTQAHESLGYTREEFMRLDVFGFIIFTDQDERRKLRDKLLKGGEIQFVNTQKKKSGEIVNRFITASLVDIGGRKQIVASANDITELMEKERLLVESNKKYRDFQDNVPVGIYQTNNKGELLYVNNTAVSMFGYNTADEIKFFPVGNLYANKEDREVNIKQLLQFGYLEGKEVRLKKKDGSHFWGLLDSRAKTNKQGNIIHFLGSIMDITKRKKAEEDLDQANKQIMKINESLERRFRTELSKREKQQQLLIQKSKLESLGEMAAGIAHEINQPLGVISLSLENLSHKIGSKKITKKYFDEKFKAVFFNIEKMRQIIDHIRTFSRDQRSVMLEKIDINIAIRNALSMISTQYKIHGIEISVDFSDNLGFTIGNAVKFEQVIMNLLSNSKYAVDKRMERSNEFEYRKKIGISTYNEDEKIFIEFRDNGTGIDKNQLRNIFDPFFTTKEEGRGTGLGLSIVYGIIVEMNGDIKISSKKGSHTIATIVLPRYVSGLNE
ncbi:MAG: PAS domain S-box protein, partial [Bacteroidales bacterium]|nr:PAS domain S-box protein [Bacteroidales bacterium]